MKTLTDIRKAIKPLGFKLKTEYYLLSEIRNLGRTAATAEGRKLQESLLADPVKVASLYAAANMPQPKGNLQKAVTGLVAMGRRYAENSATY